MKLVSASRSQSQFCLNEMTGTRTGDCMKSVHTQREGRAAGRELYFQFILVFSAFSRKLHTPRVSPEVSKATKSPSWTNIYGCGRSGTNETNIYVLPCLYK